MKLKPTIGTFKPESLRLAAAVSDFAEFTGQDIAASLFVPSRTCEYCREKAEVFIGPKHVCALCWARLFIRLAGASKRMLEDVGPNRQHKQDGSPRRERAQNSAKSLFIQRFGT